METVLPSGCRIDPPFEPMKETKLQTRTSACFACYKNPNFALPEPVNFLALSTSSPQVSGAFAPSSSSKSFRYYNIPASMNQGSATSLPSQVHA
jgi:hypothetical protein